ncbi:uncharacterized protein LOC128662479 [Bombina bombina]|uniref:uncharacterized protein LOC128662479 n=1 Tax=Bombina bombina TaxID=8345 RepID=UPI00235ADD23|nr:uncharacterized protein LOC128662479 [Bombina bombina]
MSSAGQFEHVAHMNVFESSSMQLSIPVKLCPVKMPFEDTKCMKTGFGENTKCHVNNAEHKKHKKKNDASKILDEVKLDLRLSECFESAESEDEEFSHERTKAKTSATRRGRKQLPENQREPRLPYMQEDADKEEWRRAQRTIEEFLDLPATVSGFAFRKPQESITCKSTPAAQNDHLPQNPAAIPNTRHNAIFLRGLSKVSQHCQPRQQHLDIETFGSTGQYMAGHHENGNDIKDRSLEPQILTKPKNSKKRENQYLGKQLRKNKNSEVLEEENTHLDTNVVLEQQQHLEIKKRDKQNLGIVQEENHHLDTQQGKSQQLDTKKGKYKQEPQLNPKNGDEQNPDTPQRQEQHLDSPQREKQDWITQQEDHLRAKKSSNY